MCDTNSAPSFFSYDSHPTKQVIWNRQWFKWQRDLIVLRDRNVLGFFFTTHTAAWHRLWVSHHTIVWKGKQIQCSRVFFSLWSVFFSLCPEGLRDFPKVIWISLKGKGEKVGLWVTLKGSWLFRRRKKNPKISAYKELLCWEWISAYISPSPMETNRLKIQHVGIRLSTISKKEHL